MGHGLPFCLLFALLFTLKLGAADKKSEIVFHGVPRTAKISADGYEFTKYVFWQTDDTVSVPTPAVDDSRNYHYRFRVRFTKADKTTFDSELRVDFTPGQTVHIDVEGDSLVVRKRPSSSFVPTTPLSKPILDEKADGNRWGKHPSGKRASIQILVPREAQVFINNDLQIQDGEEREFFTEDLGLEVVEKYTVRIEFRDPKTNRQTIRSAEIELRQADFVRLSLSTMKSPIVRDKK